MVRSPPLIRAVGVCGGHGCSSHAARHHLHRLDLMLSVLKALRPNQILLIFLHND